MGGGRLLDAVELDQHDALANAFLISLGGVAAGEKTPAAGGDRRSGELGVFGEPVRVGNRKVGRNPVSLGLLPNALIIRAPARVSVRTDGNRGFISSLRAKRSKAIRSMARNESGKESTRLLRCPLAGLVAMTNLIRRSPRGKRAADIENERTKRAGQQA